MAIENQVTATGGCLCGAVRCVRDPRPAAQRGQLPLQQVPAVSRPSRRLHLRPAPKPGAHHAQAGLKWYRSVTDETPNVHRGFCGECGSSLFWDPRGSGRILAVAAGSLDSPTGLRTIGHVWTSQAGDYYKITDDHPQFEKSHAGKLT